MRYGPCGGFVALKGSTWGDIFEDPTVRTQPALFASGSQSPGIIVISLGDKVSDVVQMPTNQSALAVLFIEEWHLFNLQDKSELW